MRSAVYACEPLPYPMKRIEIDNFRIDGDFEVNGDLFSSHEKRKKHPFFPMQNCKRVATSPRAKNF
jgi:hypothetical protein